MKRIAVIGAGKMGISHCSILGANRKVEIVGIADTTPLIQDVLTKHTPFPVFSDYRNLIDQQKPDAAVVSVPTLYHDKIVSDLLDKRIHVFVEKPFVLKAIQGARLISKADAFHLINQVGYHCRFIATFQEAHRIISSGLLGELFQFSGSVIGNVFNQHRKGNWRSDPVQGGCILDYSSHLIDLVHFLIDDIEKIHHAELLSLYGKDVEDVMTAIVSSKRGIRGTLYVNWSDPTIRKMNISMTVMGSKGKLIVDGTELKLYLRSKPDDTRYSSGWNLRSIDKITSSPEFYLRGEEYSLQMDHFIEHLYSGGKGQTNTFLSAIKTDYVIDSLRQYKIHAV